MSRYERKSPAGTGPRERKRQLRRRPLPAPSASPRTVRWGPQRPDLGPLLIASNRLPVVLRPCEDGKFTAEPASGGLVTALSPVLARSGGTWVGWPGITDADHPTVSAALHERGTDWKYRIRAVPMSETEHRDHYLGFANSCLWPLLHGLPDLCAPEKGQWEVYRRVNHRFARTLMEGSTGRALTWVHDYHLMLVGRELRSLGADNRLAFFLHTPFPRPDILSRLPEHQELLAALLAFDLVGFQTREDEANFHDSVRRLRAESVGPSATWKQGGASRSGAQAGRDTRSGAFPISIDYREFAVGAARPGVIEQARRIRTGTGQRTLVLGVDRLDYSKGIPDRLRGLRYALEQYPEVRGRLVLKQLVVPSRESIPAYSTLKAEIEDLVSEINDLWGRDGHLPVDYRYGSWERTELLAHYRAADAALITPLKDGMNLVAKEFCAANGGHGVLILSAFAGAARELGRDALLVNPGDAQSVAAALKAVGSMAPREREARMTRLKEAVRRRDIHRWADDFLTRAV